MKVLIKQPGETLREQLVVGGVATISAMVSIGVVARGYVPGGSPLLVTHSMFAGAAMLQIEGGADGERYMVTAIVDDADGERREQDIEVAVLDLAWQMPDGGAPMLSIADFVARFGIEETVRMTDERGDGRIGRDLLVRALTDAQAIVEMHVSVRYSLPLIPVPITLEMAIADIARGRLYPNGAPEGIDQSAKAALRMLERIQSGALPLPGADAAIATTSDTPILHHSAGRTYPDGLKDF